MSQNSEAPRPDATGEEKGPARVLLANLGSHDIQPGSGAEWPEWQQLWSQPSPTEQRARISPRAVGEFLYAATSSMIAQKLLKTSPETVIPILSAYLQYLEANPGGPVILHLFGTDQAETSPYRSGDTYPLARALKKHASAFFPRDCTVQTHQLSGNPTDLYSLSQQYRKYLSRIRSPESLGQPAQIFVGLTGGTPQMNLMLAIESFMAFADHSPPTFLHKPEHGLPREMPLPSFLHTVELNALLEAFAFKVVGQVFARTTVPPAHSTLVRHLAMYGHYRLNSDWPNARSQLVEAQRQTGLEPQQREQIDRWVEDMERLQKEPESQILFELLFQAEIVLRQGNFWSFLLRLVTVREMALHALAIALGVDIHDNETLDEEWLDTHPDVRELLASRKLEPKASVPVLLEVVRHLAEAESQKLVDFLYAMQEFQRKRNEVVHRGAPVDDQVLRACTQAMAQKLGLPETLTEFELVETFLALLAETPPHPKPRTASAPRSLANPFVELRDLLRTLIGR